MIEWIQVILEFLAMIGIIFLIMFKKNYFPKYLEEKGKNLATKEDVADITKKVESVKLEHNQKFDEIQKKNDLFFSEIKSTKERFNAKQFELYNELWSALIELKFSADTLWESATKIKLKDFSKKLSEAKKSMEKSSLLIEDEHYNQLNTLIIRFEEFEFGKGNLIKLKSFKNKTTQEIDNQYINDSMIEYIISQNEEAKTEYDTLLLLLKTDFKKQITGTHLKGMTINQGQN